MIIFQILILFLSFFFTPYSFSMRLEDGIVIPTQVHISEDFSISEKNISYRYISSYDDLSDFCSSLSRANFIAIDTEFKQRGSPPELCLIQVSSPDHLGLIDPRVNINLTPFYALLKNPEIIKVFHAGRTDIEIFLDKTGVLPEPFFDTQIAAQFCGYGDCVGYKNLVQSLCYIFLDKSEQLSDWTKRPLTQSQLKYATYDVLYLREIYPKILLHLQEKGRLKWALDEMKERYSLSSFIKYQQPFKRSKSLSFSQKEEDLLSSKEKEKEFLKNLKGLLAVQAKEHELSAPLIVTSHDLKAFVRGETSLKMLESWRLLIFGDLALKEKALYLKNMLPSLL